MATSNGSILSNPINIDLNPTTFSSNWSDYVRTKVDRNSVPADQLYSKFGQLMANWVDDSILRIQARLGGSFTNVLEHGALGDGSTDDTSAIQNAINYIYNSGSGGGTVIIPSGTYVFSEIELKSNVRLLGFGGTLKVEDPDVIPTEGHIDCVDYSNIIIENLNIDGNKANNTVNGSNIIALKGDNCSVINCNIYDAAGVAIDADADFSSICFGNNFRRINDAAINAGGSIGSSSPDKVIITSNRISSSQTGIRVTPSAMVEGNSIYDCGIGIDLASAFFSDDFDGVVANNVINFIGQNYLDDGNGYGIRASLLSNGIIANNRISNAIKSGIVVLDCDNFEIIGNVINNDTTSNLTASSIDGHGIYLDDGVNYCSIDSNIIYNSRVNGIFFSGSEGGSYNKVSNNIVKVNQTSGSYALKIDGGSSTTWSDLQIYCNTFHGRSAIGDLLVTGTYTALRFDNNTFVNNSLNGTLDFSTQTIVGQFLNQRITVGTQFPTSGTWRVGDWCINSSPASSSQPGWVCINAGTPGTWVGFR